MSQIDIFLGGTVGNSDWRTSFIADLVSAGIPKQSLYNPVVPDWTPECQAQENHAKATARYNLFYITNPNQDSNHVSVYSIVEAVMGLYDDPTNTVVVFDNYGYSGHVLKALRKSEQDLRRRFPDSPIFSQADEALSFLKKNLLSAGSQNVS